MHSSFRDNFSALKQLGADSVFGLSTQDTAFQKEAKERLNLPYDFLSDVMLEFLKALKMPVFQWEGKLLIKRCTLAIRAGRVEHVWYPVFPAFVSPYAVIEWLGDLDDVEH